MHLNNKNNFFERYKKLLAKSLLFVFVATNILMPVSAIGVETTTTTGTTNTTTTSTNTTTSSSNNLGTSVDALIQSSATCSIGNILSKLISSTVGKAIQELTGKLTGLITGYVKDLAKAEVKTAVSKPEVPVADAHVVLEAAKVKDELRMLTAKETGSANVDTDSILSGFLAGISTVSLDSIMFCIINEIMAYITKATIDWINSGFNGNPVFVENPGSFFQGIADTETSNFLKELSGKQNSIVNGVVSNTIIAIADPLRDSVVNSILGTSNTTFADRMKSTMSSDLTNNYSAYTSGQKWLGVGSLSQIAQPQNNYYGLTMMAESEQLNRITAEQQNQAMQLLYNSGYKSKTTCPSGKTRSDGTCYPYYSVVSVAGSQTKDELQSRGMMKYLRISFANDFDSIITALVNQLIKIAVTEVFEATNDN